MSKTVTEAEVRRVAETSTTDRHHTPNLIIEEQPGKSKLAWVIVPAALLIATGTVFLAFRRWLNSDGNNDRLV